jgi:rod shape-determining protein MreC
MNAVPYLRPFLTFFLISVAVFTLDSFKFLSLPKSGLSYITNPIQYGLYTSAQGVGRQFYFVFQARFAAQENKAMQAQVAQLISENASLRTKLAETEAQLTQQQSLDPRTYNLVSARPIGLDRFLKIDRGSNDGLKQWSAVIFKDNYIGQITGISERGAEVKLAVDPDSKLSAFALDKDGKAKGVLTGQFGSEMLLDKILHEEPIKEGDLVYSEGLEGFLPRGLILGTVTEILDKETQVFKQAKVKPIFDVRDLELVFIIKE